MLIPYFILLLGRWRSARRLRQEAADLRALDDRTLRDLGLTRGELLSWLAEDQGREQPTRRRVRAGGPPPSCARTTPRPPGPAATGFAAGR